MVWKKSEKVSLLAWKLLMLRKMFLLDFSTNQLPVSEECIPKQEDVARWPYLNDVRLPKEADDQKIKR